MSDPVKSAEPSSVEPSSVEPSRADVGTAEKDPDDWATGDEPMTGPQRSYLNTLAQQAGEPAPPDELSKADASKLIEELQQRTGRGA